ncbi:hypothetical protein DNTS_027917 [Danionella cerebrum]|uniref:Odontogenic ameloblast-associated protein n=1 Tax=Danionella cerebrum TaxID=2873325 RepID=A0A553PZ09_9TELE|nr:hypothetical protein DNTS_027917 [Danionella translucida]
MMKLQVIILIAALLSICTSVPIFQPQIGILASASNEILGLNGLTLGSLGLGPAQGPTLFSPFLMQQQPPQVLNYNPGLQGAFLPPQINQGQQDQPLSNPGQGPNIGLPAQNPPPGYPYFLTNFYPMRPPLRLMPNQNTVPNVQGQGTIQQMMPVQPVQPIQPIQNRGKGTDAKVTSAPDYRGDRPGPGIGEGNAGFPLFEP